MLTTVVIIAVILAVVIGVIALRGKTKAGPTSSADPTRPDAPPGYNARSNEAGLEGSGKTND